MIWHRYQWRLCLYYIKLNQINYPFSFTIPGYICADKDIYTEVKFFIEVEKDSGYYQVVSEEEAQENLKLFALYVKVWCKAMDMGVLNTTPMLMVMVINLQT